MRANPNKLVRVLNNMRSRNIIYIAVVVICFPATGLSLESPGSSNPLGLGTVPPTAYKSGLIPSINPIDTRNNQVITGNVTGGMHFRGIVPYSSVTDFSVPSQSGVDSFLRRTEGSQVYEKAGSGPTPYYSPLTTVSRTIPGSGGAVTPQLVSGYRAEQYPGTGLQSGQTGYYQGRYTPSRYMLSGVQRPLSTSPLDIEKTIDVDVTQHPQAGSEEQRQEQFWKKMGLQMTRRTGLAEESLEDKGLSRGVEPNIGLLLGVRQEGQLEGQAAKKQQSSILAPEGKRLLDVYEQMKIQVSKPVKITEGLTESTSAETRGQVASVGGQALRPDSGQAEPNARGEVKAAESTALKAGGAEGILDTYKSFAAYHDDKFNRNMRMAEYYMKQGRFYRAADAYTLATVYKPGDPLGYAGKSIAMFATGEYMSSALFLARTLEIFPEYAEIRVDLVAIIGDKDMVENRIIEAREWADRSESGELEFLLSYVYYQMDRLEFARQTIESAASKLPDSQAIATMKKAIEERIAKP